MSLSARRAWIEIPVVGRPEGCWLSLSARRAWIEIFERTEWQTYLDKSLSARRAWIEIFVPFDVIRPAIVALRKESVDRNTGILAHHARKISRSPQGERG